jgi:leader peptidase (prepilin peptidase)/N-methyltransferase
MTILLTDLPLWFWYVTAFAFGAIIGSFLNVVIYRFHTGKSLAGHSHCLSCANPLSWYELFPLFSYLGLWGRCRSCGCHIPARYFLVELATGLLFIAVAAHLLMPSGLGYQLDLVSLMLLWALVSVLLVITVYDLYHFIIPDKLTVILTVLVGGLIGWQLWGTSFELSVVLWQVGAAALGSGFFLFLWVISKGTWLGFGDVKLAFPLGLLVGPASVFSFVVLSFWIGAFVSLFIMAIAHLYRGKAHLQLPAKTLTIKSAVPFAPFLVASALVVFFLNFNVLEIFSF